MRTLLFAVLVFGLIVMTVAQGEAPPAANEQPEAEGEYKPVFHDGPMDDPLPPDAEPETDPSTEPMEAQPLIENLQEGTHFLTTELQNCGCDTVAPLQLEVPKDQQFAKAKFLHNSLLEVHTFLSSSMQKCGCAASIGDADTVLGPVPENDDQVSILVADEKLQSAHDSFYSAVVSCCGIKNPTEALPSEDEQAIPEPEGEDVVYEPEAEQPEEPLPEEVGEQPQFEEPEEEQPGAGEQ